MYKKISLFTFQPKYVMIKAVKAKKRNSTCPIRFQRAAGRCETADEKQGTRLGASAQNLFPQETRE